MNQSLDDLVLRLNAWSERHRILPANGQVADSLSARTLRYYRTTGLMDAPTAGSGMGKGYGERHFLQAAAVRLLQAQGLPLNRIHALLFGRSDEDLSRLVKEGVQHTATIEASAPARSGFPELTAAETWSVLPLDADWMLVSRRQPAAAIPRETLAQIRALLSSVPAGKS